MTTDEKRIITQDEIADYDRVFSDLLVYVSQTALTDDQYNAVADTVRYLAETANAALTEMATIATDALTTAKSATEEATRQKQIAARETQVADGLRYDMDKILDALRNWPYTDHPLVKSVAADIIEQHMDEIIDQASDSAYEALFESLVEVLRVLMPGTCADDRETNASILVDWFLGLSDGFGITEDQHIALEELLRAARTTAQEPEYD